MTSSSLGLSCRIHSKGKSDDHYSQRRYDKPGKVPGFRALMPRSLSSKRNWTEEGSPAASGQVSGQGRGQAAPRLTSDDSIRIYVPPVEALDVGILHGLAGIDEVRLHPHECTPRCEPSRRI